VLVLERTGAGRHSGTSKKKKKEEEQDKQKRKVKDIFFSAIFSFHLFLSLIFLVLSLLAPDKNLLPLPKKTQHSAGRRTSFFF
jgi:hypothetical protein